jgi:hypothetical protein
VPVLAEPQMPELYVVGLRRKDVKVVVLPVGFMSRS